MNMPIKPAGQSAFKDRYTTKVAELLKPWEEGDRGAAAILGVPLSKPSISHSGASFAPGAIRNALNGFTTYRIESGQDLTSPLIDFGDVEMHPTSIMESHERITTAVRHVLSQDAAPFTSLLGGDHSITTSAVKAFCEEKGTVGIIQFDAHHDLRNTEDGGPTNGTPFRRLLQEGVIKGENLIQIGIRNYSNAKAYHEYALDQGVTVHTMKDVRERGPAELVRQGIEMLKGRVNVIYLSVDMDVLDQSYAPGCPAISPGGMNPDELLDGLREALKHPGVTAMDIVEIDPTLDFRDMTSRIAALLVVETAAVLNT